MKLLALPSKYSKLIREVRRGGTTFKRQPAWARRSRDNRPGFYIIDVRVFKIARSRTG